MLLGVRPALHCSVWAIISWGCWALDRNSRLALLLQDNAPPASVITVVAAGGEAQKHLTKFLLPAATKLGVRLTTITMPHPRSLYDPRSTWDSLPAELAGTMNNVARVVYKGGAQLADLSRDDYTKFLKDVARPAWLSYRGGWLGALRCGVLGADGGVLCGRPRLQLATNLLPRITPRPQASKAPQPARSSSTSSASPPGPTSPPSPP